MQRVFPHVNTHVHAVHSCDHLVGIRAEQHYTCSMRVGNNVRTICDIQVVDFFLFFLGGGGRNLPPPPPRPLNESHVYLHIKCPLRERLWWWAIIIPTCSDSLMDYYTMYSLLLHCNWHQSPPLIQCLTVGHSPQCGPNYSVPNNDLISLSFKKRPHNGYFPYVHAAYDVRYTEKNETQF